MIAPVVGSGLWPAWMASVSKRMVRGRVHECQAKRRFLRGWQVPRRGNALTSLFLSAARRPCGDPRRGFRSPPPAPGRRVLAELRKGERWRAHTVPAEKGRTRLFGGSPENSFPKAPERR